MWSRVGVCEDWRCGERLWHAGLSPDGCRCFVADCDDNAFIVWDVLESKILWKDDATGRDSPIESLHALMTADGWAQLGAGPAAGRYRIFGFGHNYAKTSSSESDLKLDVRVREETLVIRRISNDEIVCKLPFEAFSGDWAFASFSEDASTIAVVEPYYVTFFRRK